MKKKSIKLKRTFKEGFDNFYRNGWLSFATVSVLGISLYLISVTLILGVSANMVLKNIQDKINVSIYFNSDIEENRILEIKNQLIGYKEIKNVEYISKEVALEEFKKLGSNNDSISKALEEIGDNPLLSALVLRANDPNQYELIVKSIESSPYSAEINRIDFQENKLAIERLRSVIKIVQQVGLTLGIVFVFIGILITFNAIRLTMYSHRNEFEIERLVGASNLYIRMPFIFEGIFYGTASAIFVTIALLITSKFLSPITQGSVAGSDLFSFYLSNFFKIFFALLFFGISLGVVSSFIAIKRYLKI